MIFEEREVDIVAPPARERAGERVLSAHVSARPRPYTFLDFLSLSHGSGGYGWGGDDANADADGNDDGNAAN